MKCWQLCAIGRLSVVNNKIQQTRELIGPCFKHSNISKILQAFLICQKLAPVSWAKNEVTSLCGRGDVDVKCMARLKVRVQMLGCSACFSEDSH